MKKLLLFIFLGIIGLQAFALKPHHHYKHIPKSMGLSHDEIDIPTPDGAKIHAWYFDTGGEHLIVISHNGYGNMSEYLNRVNILTKQGFNVLTYDYRGYGKSSHFKVNKYQYIYAEFYTDLKAVLEYCKTNYYESIIAYGWGIGGGVTLSVAYEMDGISGIIADDPFFNYQITQNRFDQINARMSFPESIEKGLYDIKPGKKGKDIKGILLFHGSNNFLYGLSDIYQLTKLEGIDDDEIYHVIRENYKKSFSKSSIYNQKIFEFVMNI